MNNDNKGNKEISTGDNAELVLIDGLGAEEINQSHGDHGGVITPVAMIILQNDVILLKIFLKVDFYPGLKDLLVHVQITDGPVTI